MNKYQKSLFRYYKSLTTKVHNIRCYRYWRNWIVQPLEFSWGLALQGGYKGLSQVFDASSIKACLNLTSLIRKYYTKKLPTWLATIIGNLLNFTNIIFRHLNWFLCLRSVTKVYISLWTPQTPNRDIEWEPSTKNYPLVDCYMIGLFNPFIDRKFNPLYGASKALIDFDRTSYHIHCW